MYKGGDVFPKMKMSKIIHGYLEYFNCNVRINDIISSSSDKVFNASAKGQKNLSFHVGKGCNYSHYETVVHAKLALFFVLCKKFSVSVEDYFLMDTDLIVLRPLSATHFCKSYGPL